MKNFAKHLPHYLSLFIILLAGFVGLVLFSYDKKFQVSAALITAGAYVTWGIVHHTVHKDLYLETIIEYIAIAILGLVIIFSLIIRS
jgi:FtsH-binding integral membrane protein